MEKIKFTLFLIPLILLFPTCASLPYAKGETRFTIDRIKTSEIQVIKNFILNEEYRLHTKENTPYKGALITQFSKTIPTGNGLGRVGILLSFKPDSSDEIYSKNCGIWIYPIDLPNNLHVQNEILRIKNSLAKFNLGD